MFQATFKMNYVLLTPPPPPCPPTRLAVGGGGGGGGGRDRRLGRMEMWGGGETGVGCFVGDNVCVGSAMRIPEQDGFRGEELPVEWWGLEARGGAEGQTRRQGT